MSITEAPPVRLPTLDPDAAAASLREGMYALEVTAARLAEARDIAAAELAKQVEKNTELTAVLEQRNLELAEAGLRIVRLEQDRDALLGSCFARQTALTDRSVRERLLAGQIAGYRAYLATLERLLDETAAENDALKSAAVADTVTIPAIGRRRRH